MFGEWGCGIIRTITSLSYVSLTGSRCKVESMAECKGWAPFARINCILQLKASSLINMGRRYDIGLVEIIVSPLVNLSMFVSSV